MNVLLNWLEYWNRLQKDVSPSAMGEWQQFSDFSPIKNTFALNTIIKEVNVYLCVDKY